MKKFLALLGFDAEKKQTSVKTEIVAGIVTFLAMAYILTVNPAQILVGADQAYWPSVFIATAFGAIFGTLLMAFLAKMPLAQASGMGLNSLVGGLIAVWAADTYGVQFTLGQAFMMVLISGLIFLALTLIKINGKSFRELVFDGMPQAIRTSISVGIGLFIAYIGFQNAGVIIADPYVQVGLADFTSFEASKTALVALIGLFLIAILDRFNVKGSIIMGIIGATLIGIPFGVTDLAILKGDGAVSWKFWESFANFFTGETTVFASFTDVFTDGLVPEGGSIFTVIMVIITMCMIDMFDTMGTIVGCCGGNRVLSDENNKPYNYDKIMLSDAVATCGGAMLGTSTVTTFVESGAGVSAGGRTGLTAFSTACMFFLSMFAMPLFAVIPSAATASALIYVGVLMMKNNIKSVDFGDAITATSAFLTIIVMVLSYSITKGIGIGLLSYTLMNVCEYLVNLVVSLVKKTEKPKWDVSIVSIVVSLLFVVYFFVPATLF